MRSIPTEAAYRFRMLAERAGRLRAQAEMLRTQADKSILEARGILQAAGLDPETDDPVTDDGFVHNETPLRIGIILRRGQPLDDEPTTAPPRLNAVALAEESDARIDAFIAENQGSKPLNRTS